MNDMEKYTVARLIWDTQTEGAVEQGWFVRTDKEDTPIGDADTVEDEAIDLAFDLGHNEIIIEGEFGDPINNIIERGSR